ncbi:hypothetical protein EK21DRAFT_52918 [Setomelanomma holmii]|uniref:Uncharacterized protein n=1 Tax=Setomelanomma holmii TaxID=210430 RepID=A0A9P4HMT3_9PLEO|nr:hypothetical protein EK21DRAFT_52918 [Setomelanomma holmii]
MTNSASIRTYQEYEFSDRMLIFAHQRLYHERQSGTYGEARSGSVSRRGFKSREVLYSQLILRYEAHVVHYSQRQLTYPDDVLNAFTAVMEDETAKAGTVFCWGLPIQSFLRALLWCQRHKLSTDVERFRRRSGSCQVSFPSWSWAGWIGGVRYDLSDKLRPVEDRVHFVIAWPWDTGYDIETPSNPFTTGTLSLRVQIAEVDLAGVAPDESHEYIFSFDLQEPPSMRVQCLLVGIVHETSALDPRDLTECTHIVLAVELDAEGIYRRTGRLRLEKSHWEASKPVTQIIKFG